MESTWKSATINSEVKFSLHQSDIDITLTMTCALEFDTQSWNWLSLHEPKLPGSTQGQNSTFKKFVKFPLQILIKANIALHCKTDTSLQRNMYHYKYLVTL